VATTIDETRLQEFVGRFAGDLGAALHQTTVIIGDKLGLYAAMGDGAPVTPAELAERTPAATGSDSTAASSFISLAGCVSNDLVREAAVGGIALSGCASPSTATSPESRPSRRRSATTWRSTVDAWPERLTALAEQVDALAEIRTRCAPETQVRLASVSPGLAIPS